MRTSLAAPLRQNPKNGPNGDACIGVLVVFDISWFRTDVRYYCYTSWYHHTSRWRYGQYVHYGSHYG